MIYLKLCGVRKKRPLERTTGIECEMNVCMYVLCMLCIMLCMYVCVYICVYIYVYIYIYIYIYKGDRNKLTITEE